MHPHKPVSEHLVPHAHTEEKTIIEVSACVPGYKIGFFVSHETVSDESKTNSSTLDTTTQKAID